MKTLKLFALIFLMSFGIQQAAQAQCQAGFTYNQQGNTVYYTNTSSGTFTDFSWWLGNGTTTIVNYNPVVTYAPGMYGVCLTVWDSINNCQSTFCDTIVITGSGCPAQFSYIDSGYTVYFNPVLNTGYQYSWTFGDGASSNITFANHTYPGPGTYTACLIVSQNGVQCGTSCMTITIAASTLCDASFTTIDSAGYVFFQANTVNLNWDYVWSYGDGTSGTGSWSVHQYNGTGPYVACLYAIDSLNNCWASECDTIYPQGQGGNCTATFSYQTAGNNIYLYPYTTGGAVTQYLWNFGDGTTGTGQYPNHTYAAAGTYTVCIAIYTASGCTDSTCQVITIGNNPSCNASFTTVDSSGYTYFIADTYNANWDYVWSYGDNTSGYGFSSVHQYNGTGPYYPCLTVIDSANNCWDTYCDTVYPQQSGNCTATFGYQLAGSTLYLYPYTTGGTVTTYLWNFGDGTTGTGQFPSHTYAAPGNYTVCIAIYTSTGCTDSTCQVVAVGGSSGCQAYFTNAVQPSGLVNFTNQSAGTSQANYYWSFGDGSSSTFTNTNHLYTSPGIYYVCLTMVDSSQGCSDTYCDTVVVNVSSNCDATFQSFDSLNTWYFLPTVGNYSNYYWTFGDGSFSNAAYPTHTYSVSNYYTVCLTVTDSAIGCSSTFCDTIYYSGGGGCQAYFYAFPDSTGASNTWQFVNGSSGSYTSVVWSFGDGTSSTLLNPLHAYANPGTYYACLTIYGNNCQDSYCDTIVVGSGSNCIPNFFAMPDSVFGNGNVTFYVYNNCPGWQYVWSFGDSTTGSGPGPFIHQYNATGWYIACVTAYDNTGNSYTWCDSVYAYRLGTVGLSEMNNAIPVNVFPNPSNGDFSVRFSLEAASPLTIEVLSVEGKTLWRTEQEHPSGLSEIRLDQSVLAPGVYFLRLKTDEQQTLTRFIIQQ